ncbi:hypothetical protein IQ07DRAFT_462901, partial [Pyrenochaeta sp. DS3sAY3a]
YNNSKISLERLKRVFDPQARDRASRKPQVLVNNSFGTHETLDILEFCLENNIQPYGVSVFAPLKTAYRN